MAIIEKKWYENNYRRNLVDMHIAGWNDEFLSRFDPDEYFRCLIKAHVTMPMIYAQSHVGYCNWPSLSGEMHPGWKGQNKIGYLFKKCSDAGLTPVAYYSLIFNNWAYKNYPSWRMIDRSGFASRGDSIDGTNNNKGGRIGMICPNNEEFREFIKRQFAEMTEVLTFNGVFLDMTHWPWICYCPSCQARYWKETGKKIPLEIDWSDPDWRLFQETRENWVTDFAQFTTNELKKLKPDLTVEHQHSLAVSSWIFGINGGINEVSDYTGGDLYGGSEHQSFICKFYHGLTRNQPFEYMTSRCNPNLYDHTTTKLREELLHVALLTYAHHGAILIIDAIDPLGTLNEDFYTTLGEVYGEIQPLEPFFTGSLCADTAVYFSFSSKMDTSSSSTTDYPHIKAVLGAAKTLRSTHIPYRVISEKELNNLQRNRMIILSDPVVISQAEEEALVAYVKSGGALYMSGQTVSLAYRLLGLELYGYTQEKITYMRPADEGENILMPYTKKYPMSFFVPQVIARGVNRGKVLAFTTLPYTDPVDSSIFASIYANPPGKDTTNPAIVSGNYGKGRVLWSAAPIEAGSSASHAAVFTRLIQLLLENTPVLLITNAPPQIEITVFSDEERGICQIHCVNIQEKFPFLPIPPFKISLRNNSPIKRLYLLPGREDVPFMWQNNRLEFTVPGLEMFKMYEAG
jgi:hypothetical protein